MSINKQFLFYFILKVLGANLYTNINPNITYVIEKTIPKIENNNDDTLRSKIVKHTKYVTKDTTE